MTDFAQCCPLASHSIYFICIFASRFLSWL